MFHFDADNLTDVEQLPGHFGTRIIQLRHFEHIVDQRSKELRIVADDLCEFPAFLLRKILPGDQLGKAAYGIERRAYFVAHRPHEVPLEPLALLRALRLDRQVVLQVLDAQQVPPQVDNGDDGQQQDSQGEVERVLPFLSQQQCFVPLGLVQPILHFQFAHLLGIPVRRERVAQADHFVINPACLLVAPHAFEDLGLVSGYRHQLRRDTARTQLHRQRIEISQRPGVIAPAVVILCADRIESLPVGQQVARIRRRGVRETAVTLVIGLQIALVEQRRGAHRIVTDQVGHLLGNIGPAPYDLRIAVIIVEHRKVTVGRMYQPALVFQTAVSRDQAGDQVGMEIPACRRTHPPQQGEFVVPEWQAALHLQVSFGRDQPEGGYAFQEEPRRLFVYIARGQCPYRVDVFTAQPRGLLRPGNLYPACQLHHAVISPEPLHAAAPHQRLRLRQHPGERIPGTGRGDVVRSERTQRRPDGKSVTDGGRLVEQLATVIQFVFRGVVQVFQVQQNIDTFAGIRLRLVSRFQRIYEMRRRCRGRSDHPSDSQQRPQGFFHISWNWRSNIGI